jgi:Domain of unknown function (DUF4360)
MTQQRKYTSNRTLNGAALTLAIALAAGFSPAAFAQSVALSNFTYTGSGCPASSAKANIINQGRTLRVEFSQFKVAMNGTKGTPQLECQISAFLTAPGNTKIEISPAEYNGNYSARAKIQIDAGHVWANANAGPWKGNAGTGGAAAPYKLTNTKKTVFGVCGGKNELKDDSTNKGIKLSINAADMVSADLKFVDYYINSLPCEGKGKGGGGEVPDGDVKGGKG